MITAVYGYRHSVLRHAAVAARSPTTPEAVVPRKKKKNNNININGSIIFIFFVHHPSFPEQGQPPPGTRYCRRAPGVCGSSRFAPRR